MSDQEKIPGNVILKKAEDWDNWFTVVRTAAKVAKAWQYLDPDTAKDELLILKLPTKPRFTDVKPCVTSLTNMDAGERDQFRYLENEYKDAKEVFEKRESALDTFRSEIQKPVHKTVLTQIRKCVTPYEMLVMLNSQFSRIDITRQQDVRTKYRSLHTIPKARDLEKWLDEWLEVVHDAQLVKLPDVQDHWPVRDFVRTVTEMEPSFYTYWMHKKIDTGKFHGVITATF